ncbi:OmpH family outer membrane protein [Flavobacterium azooxidireducens]|uniref:OmpH family outer membrane protein n=1 Tax=Flavobacterium azooxidireducens TaxID=1871076 RepID=A0ABY4KI28_9FLAO|nr:OmpH family outer membrane protein [Flavobacterium azooxidireducens]UPQ80480.1 OmpH family outer membrane protein [Flavobacterium azooxidireducens]
MKKSILVFGLLLAMASCDKAADQKDFKTAYVDTSKLLDEYTEAKDIEEKYKSKGEEMGKQLEAEVARFRTEAAAFQKNAETYGPQWAQQKGAELQRKEQELSYAQQAILRQLQEESGKEMDSLVKDVKKFIKDYGKEKGYNYIYGTGDAATVLYAKDEYDITNDVIKLLNDKYKSTSSDDKKDEKADTKVDSTKK